MIVTPPSGVPCSTEVAMAPLSLDRQRLIIGVLVTVGGEVDATNAPHLEAYLRQEILPGEPLVLDLGALTFMDSSALNVLIRLDAALREQNTTLRLAAVSDVPARVLQITGVWSALHIHPSVEEAIAALLAEHTAAPAGLA
ncbi:STAS domain-containing protein [Nonomuraea rhizosphaerae]|uniref:STAS domain-containing protein n=1 Tax=Nonomuraea rhizosphaerae TaxID=2665663 RepID=UPI001C5D637B|nr:STAS domain-containing protein [Nonomuraea rhizosphaerae]